MQLLTKCLEKKTHICVQMFHPLLLSKYLESFCRDKRRVFFFLIGCGSASAAVEGAVTEAALDPGWRLVDHFQSASLRAF